MLFKNSMINKESIEGGLGTDSDNTYTFDTNFKKEEPKKEKKKEIPSFKFKFRGFEFNSETMPYFCLMPLIFIVSLMLFTSGNIGNGVMGLFFTLLTYISYNYSYIDYDDNHNLLLWNVTTTLQAFFKYTTNNLFIMGSKILMIGVVGSTLTHLKIMPNLNYIFVYMIIVGGLLTFTNRQTELLSVVFRAYGIMLIVSLFIENISIFLKIKGVYLNPFDIATFLVIYTLGVIINKIKIEQPIEY